MSSLNMHTDTHTHTYKHTKVTNVRFGEKSDIIKGRGLTEDTRGMKKNKEEVCVMLSSAGVELKS